MPLRDLTYPPVDLGLHDELHPRSVCTCFVFYTEQVRSIEIDGITLKMERAGIGLHNRNASTRKEGAAGQQILIYSVHNEGHAVFT